MHYNPLLTIGAWEGRSLGGIFPRTVRELWPGEGGMDVERQTQRSPSPEPHQELWKQRYKQYTTSLGTLWLEEFHIPNEIQMEGEWSLRLEFCLFVCIYTCDMLSSSLLFFIILFYFISSKCALSCAGWLLKTPLQHTAPSREQKAFS